MFSHIHIGVTDLERALALYSSVLPLLGLELKFHEPENSWAGWKSPDRDRPLFLIGKPFDPGRRRQWPDDRFSRADSNCRRCLPCGCPCRRRNR